MSCIEFHRWDKSKSLLYFFSIFYRFLMSLSATRLSQGRIIGLTSDSCTLTERGDPVFCISLTQTQPVRVGRLLAGIESTIS